MSRALASVIAAIVLLAVAGCAPRGAVPARPAPRNAAPAVPSAPLWPSIEERTDGSLRVVGTLRRVELEGGFWAVDVARPDDRREQGLHVVTLFGARTAKGPVVEGDYVSVEGTKSQGASFRMYGPEMFVTAIRSVAPPTGTPQPEAGFRKLERGEVRVSGYVVESHFATTGAFAVLSSMPPHFSGGRPVAVVRAAAGTVFDLQRLESVYITVDGTPDDRMPADVPSEWRGRPLLLIDAITLDLPKRWGEATKTLWQGRGSRL